MFRTLYSSSLRAASPITRTQTLQRTSLLSRTLVTKRFTKDHEWISYDSDSKLGTISITDYAQKQLGDVVFVELPSVGSTVTSGEAMGAVESVKAASDICAPASGVVKEVNPALADKPALLNSSPEDKGWLCKIEVSDASEIENLLTAEAYAKFCEDAE
ncbi:hypothetical protein BDV93DRAFT_144275 [Ceratobasidium sp. AG-I]|nr:hypothetical protein BDV93DRAFT_144275 [Ceratobasidium sp. AG-I]